VVLLLALDEPLPDVAPPDRGPDPTVDRWPDHEQDLLEPEPVLAGR
jgi:hypothetical protein